MMRHHVALGRQEPRLRAAGHESPPGWLYGRSARALTRAQRSSTGLTPGPQRGWSKVQADQDLRIRAYAFLSATPAQIGTSSALMGSGTARSPCT